MSKSPKSPTEALTSEAELFKASHELFMLKMDGSNEVLKILSKDIMPEAQSATTLVLKWQCDLIANYIRSTFLP